MLPRPLLPLVTLDLSEPDYSKRTVLGKRRDPEPFAKYLQPLCNSVQPGEKDVASSTAEGRGNRPLRNLARGRRMIPVGEQSPERSNEGKRLVEHHMMPRLRNFD